MHRYTVICCSCVLVQVLKFYWSFVFELKFYRQRRKQDAFGTCSSATFGVRKLDVITIILLYSNCTNKHLF